VRGRAGAQRGDVRTRDPVRCAEQASKPILKKEAHFRKFEDNPEWALTLYLEY
jgi:hypothetical protein